MGAFTISFQAHVVCLRISRASIYLDPPLKCEGSFNIEPRVTPIEEVRVAAGIIEVPQSNRTAGIDSISNTSIASTKVLLLNTLFKYRTEAFEEARILDGEYDRQHKRGGIGVIARKNQIYFHDPSRVNRPTARENLR